MKVYLEPETKQEFSYLPNPWRTPTQVVCGLTDTNCVDFGWVIEQRPDPEPIPEPKKYSTLSIIRVLGDDWENIYKPQLKQAGLLDQFFSANYLSEDDPVFVEFIKGVPQSVQDMLADCIWQPY